MTSCASTLVLGALALTSFQAPLLRGTSSRISRISAQSTGDPGEDEYLSDLEEQVWAA